jgi:hypothetical protein
MPIQLPRLFLYSINSSSGGRYTTGKTTFYYVDVEKPSNKTPVKISLSLIIKNTIEIPCDIKKEGVISRPEKTAQCAIIINEDTKNIHYSILKYNKENIGDLINRMLESPEIGGHRATQKDIDRFLNS